MFCDTPKVLHVCLGFVRTFTFFFSKAKETTQKEKKEKNAGRSTVGRVLRRARERPGRAHVERDGGASGREHREEQFRSGWFGQGTFFFLKSLFCACFGRKSQRRSFLLLLLLLRAFLLFRTGSTLCARLLTNVLSFSLCVVFFCILLLPNRCSLTISAT